MFSEIRAYPKSTQLHSKRSKPKRINRGKFSPATIRHIFERDGYKCVRCGTFKDIESVPHHIIFKSQGGTGEKDNGVTVCRSCHNLAHSKREVREWFERYRESDLIPYYKRD